MQNVRKTFIHFTIQVYHGYLKGESEFIHQPVTRFSCKCSNFFCIPVERKHDIITWFKNKHRFNHYTSLGNYTIQKLDSFVIINSLNIGGAVQFSTKHLMQLDNGYRIKKIATKDNIFSKLKKTHKQLQNLTDEDKEFYKKSLEYNKHVERDIHSAILSAHIASTLDLIRSNFVNMWKVQCQLRLQNHRFQRWIVRNFPTMSTNLITEKRNFMIQSVGDGFLLQRCRKVHAFQIYYNRSYGRQLDISNQNKLKIFKPTCYRHFPIVVTNKPAPLFLRLSDRRVIKHSHKIDCTNRPKYTLVQAPNGNLYHISQNGTITSHSYHQSKYSVVSSITPPSQFNLNLTHRNEEHIDHLSMLELITNNQLALEDLHELHTFGKGNLIAGIAKAIGGVLSVVTEAGSSAIHSVGGALSDVFTSVADGGSKVILSTLHGTADVIDNTGKQLNMLKKESLQ